MEEPKLSKDYLFNWLENYALEGGEHVYEYVDKYLPERYFNAQLEHLKRKHKRELKSVILTEIYDGRRKTIKTMLENSKTDTLAKIILSMQNSLQRGSKLDDIVNPPIDVINNIFINYIKDLSAERLREIVSLFLSHKGYLTDEDEE